MKRAFRRATIAAAVAALVHAGAACYMLGRGDLTWAIAHAELALAQGLIANLFTR